MRVQAASFLAFTDSRADNDSCRVLLAPPKSPCCNWTFPKLARDLPMSARLFISRRIFSESSQLLRASRSAPTASDVAHLLFRIRASRFLSLKSREDFSAAENI